MKKISLLILIITQTTFLSAQSLTVTGNSLANLNFATVLNGPLDSLDPCLPTHASLTIKNISNKDHDVLCEKNVLVSTPGMEDHFCWGGNCYGSSTIISTSTTNIPSGQSDDIAFDGVFDAFCGEGYGVVEYCFYPDGDQLDRTCFTITYNNDVALPIADLETTEKMSRFYPNPAKEFVSFFHNSTLDSELVIIDILGNKVKHVVLNDEDNQKIDVSNLSKGIYFGNLITNKEVIAIQKLVLK